MTTNNDTAKNDIGKLLGYLIAVTVLITVIYFWTHNIFLIAIIAGPVIAHLFITVHVIRAPEEWIIEYNGKKANETKTACIFWAWQTFAIFVKVVAKIRTDDQDITVKIGVEEGYGSTTTVELLDGHLVVIFFLVLRVSNPIFTHYAVANWLNASINLTETLLRSVLAGYHIDDALEGKARKSIAKTVKKKLAKELAKWGVTVSQCKVQDFEPDSDTVKSRLLNYNAKKQAEANVTEAHGKATVKKIEASAEAMAKVLVASGEAKAEWMKIKAIANRLDISNTQVMAFLLTGKFYEKGMADATIIATNNDGKLSGSINTAATMATMQAMMANKPEPTGGTTNE